MVEKTISECGHAIEVFCSIIPTHQDCQQPCEEWLSCGHPCGKKCSAKCSAEDCAVPVETTTKSLCGHQVLKSCSEIRYRSGKIGLPLIAVQLITFDMFRSVHD